MSNNESRPLIRRHMALEELLQMATPEELSAITSILLKKENERMLGDASVRQRLARSQAQGELYKVVREIAFEVRSLGSISLANLLRRGEPASYDEVVRDVAGELKVKYSETETTSSIEEKMLEILVEKLAEQAKRDNQTAAGSLLARSGLSSSFASLLEPLSKLGFGTAGSTLGLGSVAAFGLFAVLPFSTVAAVTVGVLVATNKARPELSCLTMLIFHIARIRVGVVAADHKDFVDRLRTCL